MLSRAQSLQQTCYGNMKQDQTVQALDTTHQPSLARDQLQDGCLGRYMYDAT